MYFIFFYKIYNPQTEMTHKKDVLNLIFSEQLFTCLEHDDSSSYVSEKLVDRPFEFYEQRFQPKPKEVILSELLAEYDETKDQKEKSDTALELSYKFDDKFAEFVEIFLKLHPCSEKKTTVDDVFDVFVEMYYAYQRMVMYRKWKSL